MNKIQFRSLRVGNLVVATLGAMALLTGCSTITPYSLEIASESPGFATISKAQAAHTIRTKVRISGEDADYRTFVVDEEGFAYKKTRDKTRAEWREGKLVNVKFKNTQTRNVPWRAVKKISPYLEQYQVLGGDQYRVTLAFDVSHLEKTGRMRTREDFKMTCKTYEDLVEVVAALRKLTE